MCTNFEKTEYELLRYFLASEKSHEKVKDIQNEILSDKKYIKKAIAVTKDAFGLSHITGTITPYFMLINRESINPSIADQLLTNLFFEYQDDQKKVPLVLTGENILGKYLFFVLANSDIEIDEKYHERIAECVIQSCAAKIVDAGILTAFFLRRDLSIELKKKVVDVLPDEILYVLKEHWEEAKLEMMMASIASANTDDETICELKELFEDEESYEDTLDKVVELIDDKLYS